MQSILMSIQSEILFWCAWVLIPLCMEILPAFFGSAILAYRRRKMKKLEPLQYFPQITVIVPVYNSQATLVSCLDSIVNSSYPLDEIKLILVDNGSCDHSFEIYQDYQKEHPMINMKWLNASQGKSKALNMALFHSDGKYIIHIDSDGALHPRALINMVTRFERNKNIHCMTGSILTNNEMIEETKRPLLKFIQKLEFCEYAQAFLAGRNFDAVFNNIFTLSGAFSAFRQSTILKTQLYNTETVCEDAHVTFQVRTLLKKRIDICENALFFVEPIEGINRLYTQRQRWQRGEIEVAHMFPDQMSSKKGFFRRQMMFDHTFAFPRMIWYFALIFLMFQDYPFRLIFFSVFIIYVLYVISGLFFYLNIISFLSGEKEVQKYYKKTLPYQLFLPLFNMVTFWFRLAGILNAINTSSAWKSLTLKEEFQKCKDVMRCDLKHFVPLYKKVKTWIYKDESVS